jgi:hypothetical protein
MSRTAQPKQKAKSTPDFSAIPEFARAIRGLANVPKKEVDEAIAKEKTINKRRKIR